MKKLKLFSLALMALFSMSMWAAEETFSFTWTSAGSAGYCYSANGPIGGVVLENNKVYFTSLNGPSKENERLNPYKTGFVFAPSTDVWMSFSATSGNSTNKNCSIRVEVIQNDYVWDAFVYSAGQAYPMPTCIFNHANGDTEELAWWKTNAGGKVITGDGSSKKPYAAGTDDASKKYMSGETASDGMAEAVFTTPICNIATKNTTESFDILNGSTKYIFESGKQYRLFVITSSGGFDLNSMTFTPAASYTITYNANGGEGEMENSTNTISACTFTAPDGYEFKEWNTAADGKGTSYAAGATATSDLDLYAIWQVHATSSDATLSALSVAGCTLSPAFASSTTAYTVALPFYASMPVVGDVTATKNDSFAKDPEVSIADNVISIACEAEDGTKKTYTVTVNIAEIPAASTSINIEQLVLDNGKSYDIAKALTDANITTDGRNGLDSIDESKDYRNYAFFGLKLKKNNADVIKVVLPASTALNVKFGSIGGATKVIINNVETQTIAADKNKPNHFFHLDATAAAREVIFRSTTNETLTLQQIKIGEECDDFTLPALFTVTYNAGAGECATTSDFVEFANDKITLPSVTPATGYAFNGWFNAAINGDKFGDAAEEKTLSKDTTLYAQFSRIDYIITYTVPTNGSYTIKVGDADAVSANTTAHYNDLVTLTITPSTGYELSTLSVKDAMDADVTVTDGKFTMPASNVTVTATFKQEGGGTAITNTSAATKAQKRIENGQLVIEKNGQVFNAMGQTIR